VTPIPRVAVVVATRNRPELLGGLLVALREQAQPIDHVVVVDSSDHHEAAEQVVARNSPSESTFVCSDRASTPHQRNLGVEALLRSDGLPDYVAFLDDDVRPAAGYLSRLVSLLEGDGRLAGACGVTDDLQVPPPLHFRLYGTVFRLWSARQGALLRSGVNVPVRQAAGGPHRSSWLIGCSVWRGKTFEAHRFHESMPGCALFEDVEFSGRVGRTASLAVDTEALLHHMYAAEGRADTEMQSFRWIRNRYEVVCTVHRSRISKLVFWWSTAGELLLLATKCLKDRTRHRAALRGAVRGARASLRGEPMV
jgi:GT2 family glycosyltransferase